MRLTERLYKNVEGLWESFNDHPFVYGIENGTLDQEKFRWYLVQDYLYLLDYVKVFALGVVKSCNEDMMRFFAENVYCTLDGEMKIHKNYMARLGVTKEEIQSVHPALPNTSYTKYMIFAGYQEGELWVLAAILSCAWSYQKIAEKINCRNPQAKDHPLFGEWVQGYLSEAYVDSCKKLIDMTDNIGEEISEEEFIRMNEIFVNCSLYEKAFWDMAWNGEETNAGVS